MSRRASVTPNSTQCLNSEHVSTSNCWYCFCRGATPCWQCEVLFCDDGSSLASIQQLVQQHAALQARKQHLQAILDSTAKVCTHHLTVTYPTCFAVSDATRTFTPAMISKQAADYVGPPASIAWQLQLPLKSSTTLHSSVTGLMGHHSCLMPS